MEFLSDGYRFAQLDADGRWRVVDDDALFAPRTLPDPLRLGALQVHQRVPALSTQPAAQERQRLTFGTRAPHFDLVVLTGNGSELLRGQPNGQVTRIRHAEAVR